MNIQTAFPGKYLKAADLGKARPIVVISKITMEDVGDDHKPIVYFQGKEKALVLNKTNANMIEEIAGSPETDDWRGIAIQLYAAKTDYGGKRVDCIRVEPPAAGSGSAVRPPAGVPIAFTPATFTPATAPFVPAATADDDVPF